MTTNHRSIENQLATGGAFIRCPFCNGKNRDDGEYIRGRQAGDPLCCDRFAAAVLEIITQAVDGQAKYPARVKQAADMIEVANLLLVESQVRAMSRGEGDGILWCPYCLVDGHRVGNRFGNSELCCFDLGEAVAGVLAKMEMQRQADAAARIADGAARLKECGVTVH